MGIGVDCVCSLWFLRPDFARSLLWCLCPLQSLCHALSSGVNHNASTRGQHFPSPSLTGSQTWVSSTTRSRSLIFGDSPLYPIQWVKSKDGATWELLRVWGILVHPSPPVQAYLWATSFIGRIFPGLHTE